MRRAFVRTLGLLGISLALASPALSQGAFPSKPLTLVVPYAAGGITDNTARTIARRMASELGQQVNVDNRGGAAGMIGTESVARAAPDGYTMLLVTNGTMAGNPALYKQLRYDPARDFVPVAGLFLSPMILVTSSAKPYRTLKELVAFGQANPGKLTFASAGAGTNQHLSSELLQNIGGFKMVHVPYKGAAPAMNDLLGGTVDVMFDFPATSLGHIKAGKLSVLAVTGRTRLPALPDVPTTEELGFKGLDLAAWSGIVVPAGTPADVVRRLGGAIRAALVDPVLMKPFLDFGSVPMAEYDQVRFGEFATEERSKWVDVVKRAGVALE
jgi:tripartite-type tricarboxylate transporter receptor subunit TctC